MNTHLELAYVGVETTAPDDLDRFFEHIAGLIPGEPTHDGHHTWRNDAKAHRIVIIPGNRNGPAYLGLEAPGAETFDSLVAGLTRIGYRLTEGSTALCESRGVSRLAAVPAPWGPQIEIVLDHRSGPDFVSPLMTSGFVTDGVGFGHTVFATSDLATADRFIVEGLGFVQSDWLDLDTHGINIESRFYHCNPRHHSIAMAGLPFEPPSALHHIMFEVGSAEDVVAAYDRAIAAGVPIANGLGRHENDRMFSFYAITPAEFQVEIGFGARTIHHGWDENRRYDRVSVWGHEPMSDATPTSAA